MISREPEEYRIQARLTFTGGLTLRVSLSKTPLTNGLTLLQRIPLAPAALTLLLLASRSSFWRSTEAGLDLEMFVECFKAWDEKIEDAWMSARFDFWFCPNLLGNLTDAACSLSSFEGGNNRMARPSFCASTASAATLFFCTCKKTNRAN